MYALLYIVYISIYIGLTSVKRKLGAHLVAIVHNGVVVVSMAFDI